MKEMEGETCERSDEALAASKSLFPFICYELAA
jgi:hypothetical protein